MDFLTQILARLFEQFKFKKPAVAGIILLVLGAIVHTAHQGTVLGLYELPEWASGALQFVSLFLLAVTGTQTFRYLPADLQAKRDDLPTPAEKPETRFLQTAAPRHKQSARHRAEIANQLPRGKL